MEKRQLNNKGPTPSSLSRVDRQNLLLDMIFGSKLVHWERGGGELIPLFVSHIRTIPSTSQKNKDEQ